MIIEAIPGESIYNAAHRAVQEAHRSRDGYVVLRFNGVMVEVHCTSNSDDIATIYGLKLRILKMTGVTV